MTGSLLLLLHLLAAMAWLGGMFFAHFCLRPAAAQLLAPAQRLPLMSAALGLFLRYMAAAVFLVLASGLAMFMAVGFLGAPVGWHIMLALGTVMALVYAYVVAVAYPALRTHCSAQAWADAARALNRIRQLVTINLALGVLVVAAAVMAR